jgi:predicted nucleotidyltransferase component of viral defense system
MTEKIKNYGKSVRDKLLNVSKNSNVPYQTLLTRYFQERLLYRISQTQYKDHFLLKGGALLFAYEKFAARPTLDIDFLGKNISNDGENIRHAFQEICSVDYPEDGVRFGADQITYKNITEFKEYHGIRLTIPVFMDTIAQVLSMDIGFGDVVTPSPVDLDYPCLLDSLPAPQIKAYSLETVIAEKMQAVIDLGYENSRMKDFYDLYKLMSEKMYDTAVLQEAITNTFHHRKTEYKDDADFFSDEFYTDNRLQVRWNAFLKRIKADGALAFETVVKYLQKELKPYWEALKET